MSQLVKEAEIEAVRECKGAGGMRGLLNLQGQENEASGTGDRWGQV